MKKVLLFTAVAVLGIVSCKKDTVTQAPVTSVTFTSSDIITTDSIEVPFSAAQPSVFYSFEDTAIVAYSDSNSHDWDFGLKYTNIIVNSLSSGPGKAAAQLVDFDYNSTNTFNVTGLRKDTATTNRAILDGSWYDYNSATRTFTPKAGKTFLFKTAHTGKFVKMEMLKVDYGPLAGTPPRPTTLKYKFRYTLQK